MLRPPAIALDEVMNANPWGGKFRRYGREQQQTAFGTANLEADLGKSRRNFRWSIMAVRGSVVGG